MEPWAEEYVGIPFKVGGRTKAALDCWGLVRCILMEQFCTFLPSLSERYTTLDNKEIQPLVRDMLESMPVVRVVLPEPGDIVLLSFFGTPGHTAVYVGDNCVVHTDPPGRGLSRIERLSGSRLTNRIEGYYRVQ